MTSEPRRLSELPAVQARRQIDKLADLVGKDLVLTDYSLHAGRYGQGYKLQLADAITGEQYQVLTTGVVLCTIIDAIDPDTDLPLAVRFVRKERYYDIE